MLSFFQTNDVNTLIAKGNYSRALKLLERHLTKEPGSVQLRLLYADVLTRADRGPDAIQSLLPLVDELASEGFVAKAIAVLKKVQRIDPARRDIDDKLATLVQQQNDSGPPSGLRLIRYEVGADTEEVSSDADAAAYGASFATSEVVLPENWFEQATGERKDFHWSPLFNDFSKRELAAVIGGLRLMIKHPGAIIYTEGETGSSLFILSSGAARVYRRDADGHNEQVAVIEEGDFFGAASTLTGAPRDATVTAATECELLELDRLTFEGICAAYPRVRELVEAFHTRRQEADGLGA